MFFIEEKRFQLGIKNHSLEEDFQLVKSICDHQKWFEDLIKEYSN